MTQAPTDAPLVLIAGGGTGGHVFPALAAASALTALGARVELAGTARGLEARLVPPLGLRLHLLPVRGLRGKRPLDLARGLALLPIALLRALALVRRLRPVAVLGVGGYASGPALAAAWILGVPTALHEQNAIPGATNRILSRLARVVAVSFEASAAAFGRPVVVTGNPVRAEFFAAPPVAPAARPRLLVFGGSQGAHVINRAVVAALPRLAGLALTITHLTGERDLGFVREAYTGSPFAADAHVVAFVDDMAAAMAAADFVVSRAGATTCAELAAAGRGALLVPFAAAAGGHQEANARALVAAGAAEVMLESELGAGEALAVRLRALLSDPTRLTAMGASARSLARPAAAGDLARLVLGLSGVERLSA